MPDYTFNLQEMDPGRKVALVLVVAIMAGMALILAYMADAMPEDVPIVEEQVRAEIVMPIKSSRPGCEDTHSCYIPSTITVPPGYSVTWQNQDVAFHSVTSGDYDAPTDLFDSGHMDPNELFTVTFDGIGRYDYFCTLHPWMRGVILVANP